MRKAVWTPKEGRRPSLYFYYACSDYVNEFEESISIRLPFLRNLMHMYAFCVYWSESFVISVALVVERSPVLPSAANKESLLDSYTEF